MTPQELLAERRGYFQSHVHAEKDGELIRLLLDACDPDDAMDAIVTAYHVPRDQRVATAMQRSIDQRNEEMAAERHVLSR